MKKLWIALCLILALTMALSPLCFAAEDNYDTLADWNIRIAVPEGADAVLEGNEYYLYAQKAGSIPYVMLRTYKYSSLEKFLADFTAYMQKEYADLEVVSEAAPKSIGARDGYEVVYGYKVNGKCGIAAALEAVRKCKDDEQFGGSISQSEAFGNIPMDDEDDDDL